MNSNQREKAAQEVANKIIEGKIKYRELQDAKKEASNKFSCETPSNNEIKEIVEKTDSTAWNKFIESKEKNREKIKKPKKSEFSLFGTKLYTLFIFSALFIYYLYFININFFFDWDTLAASIRMKNMDLNVWKSFGAYHMLSTPLAYVSTWLISPIFGWDPLDGYKLIVALCAAGTGTLLYITVYKLTKNHIYASIATAFLAGNYGYLFLTLSLEDNVINSFFNMLFIFIFLAQLGEIELEFLKNKNTLLSLATGISLGLAIATHLHSALFVVLVLTIFYFERKKHENGKELNSFQKLKRLLQELLQSIMNKNNIKKVLLIAIGSIIIIGPLTSLNASVYNWNSLNDLTNFFTIDYHKDPKLWYFANENRDFVNQLKLVNWGLTSLFFQRYQELLSSKPDFLNTSKYLLFILFVIFTFFTITSIKNKTTQLMFLMLLIQIPHSIFYESWNIERWDGILLPMAVILGNSLFEAKLEKKLTIPKKQPKSKSNKKDTDIKTLLYNNRTWIAGLLVIILFLVSMNSFNDLSHFKKNPVHRLADELDKKTPEDSLIIVGIRSDSELGLYVKYAADRNLLFFSDHSQEEVLQTIDQRLKENKPTYISTIAAGTLIQADQSIKEKYTYTEVFKNGYYSLYKMQSKYTTQ